MLSLSLVGGADRAEGAPTSVQVPAAGARFTIGRDPACDWALPDRTLALSARHCEIVGTPTGPVLHDLSTNGTFVNGAKARMPADHPLRDGDRFEAGPFTVLVLCVADAAPPPMRPVAPATPMRGRDPAAVDLAALPADDLGLTRIRPAPPAARAAPPVPVPTPAPAPEAARAAPQTHPRPDPQADWRAALARGLGLPAEALAARDPLQLAEQLGRLSRTSVHGLQRLLEQRARTRRRLGSRRQAALAAASPLSLAGGTDEALLALLTTDPAAPVAEAVEALVQHQDQLLGAYRAALQRLADDLAPPSLAARLPGGDAAAHWALYAALWHRLGLTSPEAAWSAGFLEAALLHLAAVSDEDPAG